MAFLSSLFGQKERVKRVPLQSPEQQQISSQLLQQLAPLIQQQLGGGDQFQPIAQEARRQFSEKTVPSIAERFSALGGQRSSAFGQQLGSAGAGLESQLAAQGAQFGQQQRGQNLALLQSLLQPQEQTFYQPASGGLLGGLASGLAPAAGLAFGLGVPSLGAAGLSGLSQLLSGRRTSSQQMASNPQENMPLIGLLAALSGQGGI